MITVKINGWEVSTWFGELDEIHKNPHNGIDFSLAQGTPIPSFSEGIVQSLTNEGTRSFGQAVHIKLFNGDEIIYAHLSEFRVQVGQIIHRGDIIGLSGNSGFSTGPHLHVQVMHLGKAVDPVAYFSQLNDGGTTGIPILDSWSEIWKENAERIFHLPNISVNPSTGVTEMAKNEIMKGVSHLGDLLNTNSPEIITLAIILCAGGMMIAPLMGSTSGKWFGRLMGTFLGGCIWRVLIT